MSRTENTFTRSGSFAIIGAGGSFVINGVRNTGRRMSAYRAEYERVEPLHDKAVQSYYEYINAREAKIESQIESILKEHPEYFEGKAFKETVSSYRRSPQGYDDHYAFRENTYWVNDEKTLVELKARTVAEQDPEVTRLREEYLSAKQEFLEYHEHLVRTTTAVTRSESFMSGVQTGRNGGNIYLDGEGAAEMHDHDERYFELRDKLKATEDAYYDALDAKTAEVIDTARSEVSDDLHAQFPNPPESPTGGVESFMNMDNINPDYINLGEATLIGALALGAIGAFLGSLDKR